MHILIIDDTTVQAEAGVVAAQVAGHTLESLPHHLVQGDYFRRDILEDVAEGRGGIITDLMFDPCNEKRGEEYGEGEIPPAGGLLVVIQAILRGIPVVICTDAYGNHHGKEVGWIFDGLGLYPGSPLTENIGWVDTKDWCLAVKKLEELYEKRYGGG